VKFDQGSLTILGYQRLRLLLDALDKSGMSCQIRPMAPTFIDLFAGCGGLSLGLRNAGFKSLMAIEAHPDAFATYRHNLLDNSSAGRSWPEWLDIGPCDVVQLATNYSAQLATLRGSVDLIAGGPPCQGFSTNGRRNPDDPRSRMVEAYLDIVELVLPRLVLIENVRGFVSMPHATGGTYAQAVQTRLAQLGYEAWADVLIASDWGVPQRRPRYICIAARAGSLPGINPLERLRTARRQFLTSRRLWPAPTTVHTALSDLTSNRNGPAPDPEWGGKGFMAVERLDAQPLTAYQELMRAGSHGQPNARRIARHSQATSDRMQSILDSCPRGSCIPPSDRLRLGIGKRNTTPLDGQAPSPTVTTLPDDLIHYSEPRAMSVRELARLQSFPDWFSFQGPYTTGGSRRKDACPRFTQVGNAVPPLFAEAIGETLRGLLADQQLPQLADIPKLREEVLPVSLEVVDS
jgi:DNA (cytosine-5)-methyltransferase 1